MDKTQTIQYPVGHPCYYNNQVCVGGFKPTIKEIYRTNSPHGLCLANVYLFGTFRDEEKGIYVYIRHIGVESIHNVWLYYKAMFYS